MSGVLSPEPDLASQRFLYRAAGRRGQVASMPQALPN